VYFHIHNKSQANVSMLFVEKGVKLLYMVYLVSQTTGVCHKFSRNMTSQSVI